MRKLLTLSSAIALISTGAFAYQVTGPVTAVNDKTITVEKGGEKWEIAKGSANVPSDVKVGSKVTIEYSMTASKVTAKDAPKSASTEDKSKSADKLAPAAGKKTSPAAPASTQN